MDTSQLPKDEVRLEVLAARTINVIDHRLKDFGVSNFSVTQITPMKLWWN
ncbi:hypothetical protein GWO43_02030 [candidate division KSB1 bacterium]|nr:hypothetical protein [candidate division KSB1 bacterium]NIT69689.1 hypothetical protein [candidate division KSB1 bacterium]NIX69370.1 hypothetical protein [candidate division KSB1 bacterium]